MIDPASCWVKSRCFIAWATDLDFQNDPTGYFCMNSEHIFFIEGSIVTLSPQAAIIVPNERAPCAHTLPYP